MRKFSLFFAVIILSSPIFSQGWLLSSVLNGNTVEPKYSAIDNQNNLYVLSLFDTIYSPSIITYGLNDLLLAKYSSTGNLLWYKRIGNKITDVPGGITVDNNNVYITGTFYDSCKFDGGPSLKNTGLGDIFLAKYDSDGSFVFAKRVGSSSTLQSSLDIKFDGTQKILMTGFFKDSLIIGSTIADKDTLIGNANIANFYCSI